MVKQFARLISLICVVALMASFSACQKADKATEQPKTEATEQPKTEATPVETIKYKVLRNIADPNYPKDGGLARQEILKAIEQYGIKGFDYEIILATQAGQEYYTKLNLMATSGDLPDLFDVDMITMSRFADEKMLLAFDDYFKLAPHVTASFREGDLDLIRYNGRVYSLPAGLRPEAFTERNTKGFVIRTDWLTNVGMKTPETMEDFHNVLKAFTFNDPDKNGKDDTFGFATTKDGIFSGFFGAFGVMPEFWIERNGKLIKGSTLPEAKEALRLLAEYYKEGIIDPDFPIMETKQVQEKYTNSKIGVWESDIYKVNYASPFGQALQKATPTATIDIMPAPKGPNGDRGYNQVFNTNNMRAINAKVKYPERLIKVLDWCADDQPGGGFYLTNYGLEGQQYTLDKEKNRIILPPAKTAADSVHPGFGNPVKFFQTIDNRWFYDETIKAAENASKYVIRNNFWGLVPAMSEYPDLPKLWIEYSSKIITGVLPIDAFDEYVEKYYKQGGKQIEDQVNAQWAKSKK